VPLVFCIWNFQNCDPTLSTQIITLPLLSNNPGQLHSIKLQLVPPRPLLMRTCCDKTAELSRLLRSGYVAMSALGACGVCVCVNGS
jgi:hypothetical protein